jgi:hypothetical protein
VSTEPPPIFTILYTVGLRAEIGALPRLFTLIQTLRSRAAGAVLTLDLGETCIPGDPLCDATAGRALWVAMDAMGYDAFYLDQADPLSGDAETLAKLRATVVTPILTDSESLLLTKRAATGQSLGVRVAGHLLAHLTAPPTSHALAIHIGRGTGEIAWVPGPSVQPDLVVWGSREAGGDIMVGRIELWGEAVSADSPSPQRGEGDGRRGKDAPFRFTRIVHERVALSPALRPDPSILSVIEFVESEARYAARKRS